MGFANKLKLKLEQIHSKGVKKTTLNYRKYDSKLSGGGAYELYESFHDSAALPSLAPKW